MYDGVTTGDSMRRRTLDWNDVARVHELVSRWRSVHDPQAQMHIGDFYWGLRMTPNGDPLSDICVWPRPDGSLAAFAWLDRPELGDLIVDPSADSLMLDEGLNWIEGEYRKEGGSSITVVALSGDEPRVKALERRGYTPGEGGNTRFWKPLESEPKTTGLPPGFSLGHVSTPRDIERRVFVQTTSFDGFTVTVDIWRLLMERLPRYRRELDLIAVAPDGTGASACTVWYDDATRCGEFEAVGTSRAYQRRGLARAVINEGLRRLERLGATQAVVETTTTNTPAIALYQSCGFEVVGEDYGWTKWL